jgi:microcystin-dependent protein
MAYPNFLSRIANFTQANSAGQTLSYADMDTEADNTVDVVNAINSWIRGITDSTGHLVNLAAETAQSLVGAERFVATASQTQFDTSITWDSAFTALNVEVFANGTKIDSSTVTVADNAGNLRVTLGTGRTVGDVVFIAAFASGAGLLTRLQSTANGNGQSLVGLEDAGGLYTASNGETAFAEVMTKLNLLITNLGTISNYLKKDGSVAMTASFNAGSQKIVSLADGTNNTDAATVGQLTSATASLNELYTQFVNKDGSVAMTGALQMGSNKITGLAPGVASTDAATVSQIAGNNSPAGAIVMYGGTSAPSGWVLCDGTNYDGANPTYAALYAAIGVRFGSSGGASNFKVPNFSGMVPVGTGGGQTYTDLISGNSKTTTTKTIADKYGEEAHALTIGELAAHHHKVANGPGATLSTIAAANSVAGFAVGFSSYEDGTAQQIIQDTGSNTAHNVMQPSLAITFIIKL